MERVAWGSVVVMFFVLLVYSFLAYDALTQHITKLNYAYDSCLVILESSQKL